VALSSSDDATQRHTDLLRASGLGYATTAGQSKYDGDGTQKPFPSTTKGVFFSGVFSDHAVLQREPSKAAVYGVVFGAQLQTNVSVEVSQITEAGVSEDRYTVLAQIEVGDNGYAKWKAFLQPAAAGGNYTIKASCSNCDAPENSSTLVDITYGDVWFCSGQSNSESVVYLNPWT
jgi:hypothetical protein